MFTAFFEAIQDQINIGFDAIGMGTWLQGLERPDERVWYRDWSRIFELELKSRLCSLTTNTHHLVCEVVL